MSFYLSGYRFLWLLVLFDLPVGSRAERKAATNFRNDLLDLGFEMSQFSVYLKWCTGYDAATTLTTKVRKKVPPYGKVHILTFTDKQYENMVTFTGGQKNPTLKPPAQFELFQ